MQKNERTIAIEILDNTGEEAVARLWAPIKALPEIVEMVKEADPIVAARPAPKRRSSAAVRERSKQIVTAFDAVTPVEELAETHGLAPVTIKSIVRAATQDD